ncbi:MAG: hypothetical protein AAGK92_13580 [Pseudomonadota bacterium]
MAEVNDVMLTDDEITDAVAFFDEVADEDLLRFLRSLPVIGTNDDEPFTIEDLTYEALLQPYVLQAWKSVSGSPGIANRILQLSKLYKAAEAAMERETGRKRRVPRVISIPAFVDAYRGRGLPL